MSPSSGRSPAPRPSLLGAFFGWLGRLFSDEEEEGGEEDEAPPPVSRGGTGTRKAANTPAPERTGKHATAAKGKTAAKAAAPASPPVGAGAVAFAKFAGFEVAVAEPSQDVASLVPEALKEQVLAHAREHKPGPNSFPTLSTRILNLLARPDDVDISDLVRLISQDPALAASVLRVANSAALRGLSEIQSVRDAVTRMGLRDVTEVAGAMASRSLFSPEARAEYAFHRERWVDLFLDATVCGMGAARLAMETNRGRSDRAFLAGMLHDVGKTMVLKSLAAMHNADKVEVPLTDPAIDALLESLHVTVGTEVQKHWALPPFLVTVCERHHEPSLPADPDLDELHLVRVVAGLRRLGSNQTATPTALAELDDSLKVLGLNAFQFRAFHTELKEISARMSTVVAG